VEVRGIGAGHEVETFRVWSFFLRAWSEAFSLGGDAIIVQGFSARAIREVLKFLYSGVLMYDHMTLVEAAGFAEEYAIPLLRQFCAETIPLEMTPEQAFDMLQVATRVGVKDIRSRCLAVCLGMPSVALHCASFLDVDILDEVLSLPDLFLGDEELACLILRFQALEMISPSIAVRLCRQHLDVSVLDQRTYARLRALAGVAGVVAGTGESDVFDERLMERVNSFLVDDFFGLLWKFSTLSATDYFASFPGSWMTLLPGNAEWFRGRSFASLEETASSRRMMVLSPGEEMVWKVPKCTICVTGISFDKSLGSTEVSFSVCCNQDFQPWETIFDSRVLWSAAVAPAPVISCRSKDLVNCFKLSVRAGEYCNVVRVRGVLRE